jgi:hypothetical protein
MTFGEGVLCATERLAKNIRSQARIQNRRPPWGIAGTNRVDLPSMTVDVIDCDCETDHPGRMRLESAGHHRAWRPM